MDFDAEMAARKVWMGLLARAPAARLSALWQPFAGHAGDFSWLRKPETGSVMIQGRMGGSGAPFNLGETTVTRCSVTLACGKVGHAYVQGRSKAKAEVAALVDALMQTQLADRLRADLLAPLEQEICERATTRAGKAAATKVDFFTLVRGED